MEKDLTNIISFVKGRILLGFRCFPGDSVVHGRNLLENWNDGLLE